MSKEKAQEVAQSMMEVVSATPNELINAILIIMTYLLDSGTDSKDLQVARKILEDRSKDALGILEKGCGWKNYN